MSISSVDKLMDTVVKGGYCVGCGACAYVDDSIAIQLDEYGKYQANRVGNSIDIPQGNTTTDVLAVCPFSDHSANEDIIGESLYGKKNTKNNELGYIQSSYAGHVDQDEYRKNGSSGGMVTWILGELLNEGLVDGIIHVKPNKGEVLFKYEVSNTLDEIKEGAKSRYYPIEMSQVLHIIKNKPGKFAVVGLPCFIKAIRLVATQDTIIDQRVAYCVSLVCGHLKSTHFANMWAWQLGINPRKVMNIDFRNKLENHSANHYGVRVTGELDGVEQTQISPPLNQLYGSNWGWGFFKYKACDFCDDVVGETADISIGDAWLPQYVDDHKGTNVIVIRNETINKLVSKAREQKRLSLDIISPEEVVKSQSSGFNHRREGLAYRLFLTDQEKKWRPQKRVAPSAGSLSKKVKARQQWRVKISEKSHIAFQKALKNNSFEVFKNEMNPLIKKYQALYNGPLHIRAINFIKRRVQKFK